MQLHTKIAHIPSDTMKRSQYDSTTGPDMQEFYYFVVSIYIELSFKKTALAQTAGGLSVFNNLWDAAVFDDQRPHGGLITQGQHLLQIFQINSIN